MTQPPGRQRRLHEIDGLRAVAIGLVMLHHFASAAFSESLVARGWTALGNAISYTTNSGVELFFVLSGVVLLRPFMRELRPFRTPQYFRRRVQRLWPPYLAALLFAVLVIVVRSTWPTWYQVLPMFSWRDTLRQIGIVNLGWPIYNLAFWSLTPELIFYALAPLVVFVGARRIAESDGNDAAGLRPLAGLAVVCAAAAIVLWNDKTSMTGPQTGLGGAMLQFLAYTPCFLAGSLLARRDLPARSGPVLVGAGIAYLLVALYVPRVNVHMAYAFLYAGLVTLALREGGAVHRLLTSRMAVWVGERSYSLFLVHFSVLYLCCQLASMVLPARGPKYYLATRLIAGPASLFLAMLLFWYVERRFARNLVTADAFWPWQYRTHANAEKAVAPAIEGVAAPAV